MATTVIHISYSRGECTRYFHPDINLQTTSVLELKQLVAEDYRFNIENIIIKTPDGKVLDNDYAALVSYNFAQPDSDDLGEPSYHLEVVNNDPDAEDLSPTGEIHGPNSQAIVPISSPPASSPSPPPHSRRAVSGFVGLRNQGATCYLNSLLQVLFMTPAFRQHIFNFPLSDPAQKKKTADGENNGSENANAEDATKNADRPTDNDVVAPENLKNSDSPSGKSQEDTSATEMPDSELVAASSNEYPWFPKADDGFVDYEKLDKLHEKDIVYQLKVLFANLQMANTSSLSTQGLTHSFGWTSSEAFEQQDVQELARVLIDNLEEKAKGKTIPGPSMQELYRGEITNYVRCTVCGYESKREEHYYDLSVVISKQDNILESFNKFTEEETLEGDNAYFCEDCQSKQTAKKGCKIKSVPQILFLHLQRFEFDFQTFQRKKVNSKARFPNILQLDAFMVDEPTPVDESVFTQPINTDDRPDDQSGEPEFTSSDDDDDEPAGDAAKTTPGATTEVDDPPPAAGGGTAGGAPSVSVSNNASSVNAASTSKVTGAGDNDHLETQTVIATSDNIYELYAILVHSGTASFGHYYAYVKNFVDGQWYKFDDDRVTLVTDPSVIDGTQGGTRTAYGHTYFQSSANAYMLVYRKRDIAVEGYYTPGGSVAKPAAAAEKKSTFQNIIDFRSLTPQYALNTTLSQWGLPVLNPMSTLPISQAHARLDDDLIALPRNYVDLIAQKTASMKLTTGSGPAAIARFLDNQMFTVLDGCRDIVTAIPSDRNKSWTKYRVQVPGFNFPEISDDSIPQFIRDRMVAADLREKRAKEETRLKRELITVEIFRVQQEFVPILFTSISRQTPCDVLMQMCIEEIRSRSFETDHDLGYRFRRIAHRKNQTLRPGEQLDEPQMKQSLFLNGLEKKKYLFLEQGLPGLPLSQTLDGPDDIYLILRKWDQELYTQQIAEGQTKPRPSGIVDIANISFHKDMTLGDLKKDLFDRGLLDIPVEECVVCEEETEKNINPMPYNEQTLSDYSLINGDILHFEKFNPKVHTPDGTNILSGFYVSNFFKQKNDEITLVVEESAESSKNRFQRKGLLDTVRYLSNSSSEEAPVDAVDEWDEVIDFPIVTEEFVSTGRNSKISFNISSHRNESMNIIRKKVATKIGIDPLYVRLSATDNSGYGYPKILKQSADPISTVLESLYIRNSNVKIVLEILPSPEALHKTGKLIPVRIYNSKSEYCGQIDVCISRNKTVWDLKTALRDITGVPEECQIISEWYKNNFFRFFPRDDETIKRCQIRKSEIIRMDEIDRPFLNSLILPHQTAVPIQFCQFQAWEYSTYAEREMKTTLAQLMLVPPSYHLSDLNALVAERTGVPAQHLSLAMCNTPPVYESRTHFLREIKKQPQPPPPPSAQNAAASAVAEAKARGEEPSDVKLPPEIPSRPKIDIEDIPSHPITKFSLKTNDIICWDDKRESPEERQKIKALFASSESVSSSHTSKNRSHGVKIYT